MSKWITQSGQAAGPIGQGTWFLGEHPATFAQERDALRAGIDAGMTLIDTAEMYGDGRAEELVGSAIEGYDREELYLVSKVFPFNAGRSHIFQCCEDSLRRMDTDYLDLYLLHWRGSIPFSETVDCMEELKDRGLIRDWGVSNLDTDDMEELLDLPNGPNCVTDQVLYHLGSRGIEVDLLPLLRGHDISVMAYCPLAQGGSLRRGLLSSQTVLDIAAGHSATPSQVLLAFLLAQPGVIPIPRSSREVHALENAGAASIRLTAQEVSVLSKAFPAPTRKVALDML
jgi:diketogulonate reductase-like aldo/keto reductase